MSNIKTYLNNPKWCIQYIVLFFSFQDFAYCTKSLLHPNIILKRDESIGKILTVDVFVSLCILNTIKQITRQTNQAEITEKDDIDHIKVMHKKNLNGLSIESSRNMKVSKKKVYKKDILDKCYS
jgi:hypothetical protein